MTRSHLDFDGFWVLCHNPTCELVYHIADLDPAVIDALPVSYLQDLYKIGELDPPNEVGPHHRIWLDEAGERHRAYGLPAVIYGDGTAYWYRHDKLHRERDLPAVEYAAGGREWWFDGLPHRDDGKPAMITADGEASWYIHGTVVDEAGKALSWPEPPTTSPRQ